MSPTFATGAFALNWTGITHFSFRFVDQNLLGGSSRREGKDLSLRTNIMILLSIIQKELGRIILGALAKIGCWKIGFNPMFFQTHNIGHSTIPRVTNRKLWSNRPSKTDPIY